MPNQTSTSQAMPIHSDENLCEHSEMRASNAGQYTVFAQLRFCSASTSRTVGFESLDYAADSSRFTASTY